MKQNKFYKFNEADTYEKMEKFHKHKNKKKLKKKLKREKPSWKKFGKDAY